ncbi:3-deoxy-D-manno-octulosonic acid transferase [Pedobacter psychrophilus]|uniref:3-deoxy-D-manno-octulosonic acid transferase n=1 Tax=Pedobacter psychrophilus TaxID=1826909 RepID=A0A179DC31_9SPHI|nr:glycosyltransferase N-terminal domain-containing protein [Pedobacter psychrophilus]OAQ38538.1 3-deoxy-D-manno-octulosonic acid transferase [Pedobacter psychrophilus]
MPIFYNIGIKFYYFLVWIVSFFNRKAKLWIDGRMNWRSKFNPNHLHKNIWFHFASLGEFEQGKPLLQAVRKRFPDKKIVITFFSPSGYEVRKNSLLGDYILYLPLDTAKNAQDFLNIFKPEIAVFNKYEFWNYFFKELKKQQIPLYITSAIFRKEQLFFKPYGDFYRSILKCVTHFFVQNQTSADLLNGIGLNNFTISGDTRFDSVADLAQTRKDFPIIENFKDNQKIFIGGSTWLEDEKLIAQYILSPPKGWKFIIAPHEISETNIKSLQHLLNNEVIRYSEINEASSIKDAKFLIIDNIGMLSSLYAYADVAYIGGGFGAGIHNTLEAAAYGLPVIFGPRYRKFKEAIDLVSLKGGFTISNQEELNEVLNKLISNEDFRKQSGEIAKIYVDQNIGATQMIMDEVFGKLSGS